MLSEYNIGQGFGVSDSTVANQVHLNICLLNI